MFVPLLAPWTRAGAGSVASQLYYGYTPDVVVDSSAALTSALASATAGDVIGLDEGVTFQGAATGVRFDPVFGPANSGTAGNPITIVAKYPAAMNRSNSALWSRFRLTDPNGLGSVLGSEGQSFINFIGMYIDQTLAPSQGSWGTTVFSDCTDILLEAMYMDVKDAGAQDDNYCGSFVSGVDDFTHRNNYYQMKAGESPNFNNATVCTYGSSFLSEYNYWNGIQMGFFAKGSGGGRFNSGHIRRNLSRNVARVVYQASEIDVALGIDIYQNLGIGDSDYYNLDSSGDGDRIGLRVYQNTAIDLVNAFSYINGSPATFSGNSMKDNVIASPSANTTYLHQIEDGVNDVEDIDYNWVYRASGEWESFVSAAGYDTFAEWVSGTGHDTHSTTSAPTFVNAGAEDYRLVGDTGSSTGGSRGYTGNVGIQS